MPVLRIRELDTDLRHFFGALDEREHARLLERLRSLDDLLPLVARSVSAHIGSTLAPYPVDLSWGTNGAYLSGGAGVFPIELYFTADVVPADIGARWTYAASLNVHCERRPTGYSCLHDLWVTDGDAHSPDALLDALDKILHQLREETLRLDPAVLTQGQHESLPAARL